MNHTFRIGIDKISLYNFELKTRKSFKKVIDENENYYKEKIIIAEKLFDIVTSFVRFKENGEIKEKIFNKITFNPNKILTGNNISNSSCEDLSLALSKLKLLLRKNEIDIDFSKAKIADIEINLNIPVDFNEYSEVFMLFFKQLNNPKATSAITDSEKMNDFKIEESYSSMLTKKCSFKVYSKDREKKLSTKITRMEYFFESTSYLYLMTKQFDLDNSLDSLLNNPDLLSQIFKYRANKDFLKKSFNYIETNIKPVLEREYKAFKASNKLARLTNRKEERNVYKYLEQFWIFDYLYLIELVDKFDRGHRLREKKRILKHFIRHNNLEKLNYIAEFIFNH